jgi:hypothetical protein
VAEPVFRPDPRPEELAQGDLLESIEFFHPKGGSYRDPISADGIVVSDSCDFTKFRADEEKGRSGLDRFPLLVAPVVPAAAIGDAGAAGHAKAGRVMRYFPIPPQPQLADEHYLVDFWFMQPISVFELLEATRRASMSDEWQRRLQIAIDRFFSRTEVATG